MSYNSHIFLFLVSVAAVCYALPKSQWCHPEKRTKACDWGYKLKGAHKKNFQESCHRLDLCYQCGINYGWSKDSCDHRFKSNLDKVCNAVYSKRDKRSLYSIGLAVAKAIKDTTNRIKARAKAVRQAGLRIACTISAGIYYTVARTYSKDQYAKKAAPWCSDKCVAEEGDPASHLFLMK